MNTSLRFLAVGACFALESAFAASLTVGMPSVEGNTLSLPVTAAGGGSVSLAFGAAAPKDGEPVASQFVEVRTLSDGETATFTREVVLGTKVAYRLTVDGDEKAGTYAVQDPARYQWKKLQDGVWSDPAMWQFETDPKDGLQRLGYPSYGSYFVFKGLPGSLTVSIDGTYSGFAESRFGRDNEKMSLTLKGTVPGATLDLPKLDQQGTYKGNDLTLDAVAVPNIEKWVVRENCTLSVINGGVLKTRWEFRVAKENARLVVGPEALVVSSNAEPYHRLGLAGKGAEIVIDDGTLVCGQNLAINGSDDGQNGTSPKGITFRGTHPQLQIRGYAKSYGTNGAADPALTFVIPENGYTRTPIVKAGNENAHGFIDKDGSARKIRVVIDPESPFLSCTEYLEQALVDWTFEGGTQYRLTPSTFTLEASGGELAYGPADQDAKYRLSAAVGEKPKGPGAVVVSFDPAGGELTDDIRVVKTGGVYGENMNLYPSDDRANFMDLGSLTLTDNVMTYSTAGRWCNFWTRPVPNILKGRPYTRVTDILTYENESSANPWFNVGDTGSDQPAQLTWASFEAKGTGRYVQTLKGSANASHSTLERAYLDFNHDDAGVCTMTFRTSLFAGENAVADDYKYVAPGECAPCALPVPTRQGYDFAGWQTADGMPVTAATEVTALGGEGHTLVATWRRAAGTVIPVRVFFKVEGGTVSEHLRVVNTEEPYGRNVNLFPSDSRENFNQLADVMTLENNVFSLAVDTDRNANMWSKNVKMVDIGETYTYVFDLLSIEGRIKGLSLGRTGGYWPGGEWIQLSSTTIAQNMTAPGVVTASLYGLDYEPGHDTFNYLGRDYFSLAAGTKATYRVALFAGSSVTAENYAYVAPGEGLPVPLPVAVSDERVFDGWIDADGNRVTDETIVTAEGDHTLTALWKPWTLTVANQDRPRVGQPLTLATNYGDGTREGETGVVSFRWLRGNGLGDYELMPVSTDATYVPTTDDLEHFLKGVLLIDGTPVISRTIYLSKLPVAYIATGDGADIVSKHDYKNATLRLQGTADFKEQYNGPMEIKGRGNSTWNYAKKPYKLKLDKKTDLFGFGKNKHWVLLANYIDVSSLRNKTAYDMAKEFGLVAMDSTWVVVIVNGRYDGLYQLAEHIRIDKNRVDIYDWESDAAVTDETDLSTIDASLRDITGGYLWELSTEEDEVSQFRIGEVPVMFNKPEYTVTNPAMFDWCKGFWQEVWEAWTDPLNRSAKGTDLVDACDMDSLVAYWLVNETFGNDDAWQKSRYAHKDLGGKLTFGPVWDFDWGCGSQTVGSGRAEEWRLATGEFAGHDCCFYKEWLDDPWFCQKALEKYRAMRPKFDAVFGDGGAVDRNLGYLLEAGRADEVRWAERRTASWGHNARGFEQDVEIYRTFMATRLAWMDRQFASLDTLVASLNNSGSAIGGYANRPDKLAVSVKGRVDRNGVVHVMPRGDLTLKVSVKSSTNRAHVLVNGRYLGRYAVTKYGANNGVVDEIRIPFGSWYEEGERTVVELIGLSADTGAINYRTHLVLSPDSPTSFKIIVK